VCEENDARRTAETTAQNHGADKNTHTRLDRVASAGRRRIAGSCARVGDFLYRLAAHLGTEKTPTCSPSGLESFLGGTDTAVLQNRTDIHRRDCGGVWDQTREKLKGPSGRPRGIEDASSLSARSIRRRIATPVPTTILNPNKYRKFLYETSPRRRKIEVKFEASDAIDVYIVQASDLESWRQSRDYGGVSLKRTRGQTFQVKMERDFEDEWYLIFENFSVKPVAVHYEVYDV
jgi:hypothetical protein